MPRNFSFYFNQDPITAFIIDDTVVFKSKINPYNSKPDRKDEMKNEDESEFSLFYILILGLFWDDAES